ncbi:MAG: hypothetical protein CFE21_17215 [Bacteroidetes bacterium B1(2017)]|nr:MAG: hypothetical protein CFE21_17215 [Bacteroidetes bacterium B1(2017)]
MESVRLESVKLEDALLAEALAKVSDLAIFLLVIGSLLLLVSCDENNTHSSDNRNEQKSDSGIFLSPSQFTPITFLQSVTPKTKVDSSLNTFVIYTHFPADWVKASYIDTLLTLLNSQQKCMCVKDPMGSYIPFDKQATIGGYAQLFLLSYIHKTPLDLGLYCCPIGDKKVMEEILRWWKGNKKVTGN